MASALGSWADASEGPNALQWATYVRKCEGAFVYSVYTVFRFHVTRKPTTAPNTDLCRIGNRSRTEKPKNRHFGSVSVRFGSVFG